MPFEKSQPCGLQIQCEATLTFVVSDDIAEAVVHAIVDSARSGKESGDGIVWTTSVENVFHNRTGRSLAEVELT